jgi:hypothetical protein
MTAVYTFRILLIGASLAAAAEGPHEATIEMQGNVAFVRATIGNSAPLDMALDSGTKRTTLDEAVAAKLGFDLSMKAQSSGAKGMQEISVIRDQTLRFLRLDAAAPLLLAYPLEFVSKRVGRHIDGILGVEFLHKYVVEIDYPARRVRAHLPDEFVYSGPGAILPVTYDDGLPVIAAMVTPFGGKPIAARLQVDSGGASAHVMFWKGFIERTDLAAGTRDLRDVQVTAFTGTTSQKQGRVQSLQIGGIEVPEPEVGLNDYQFSDPKALDGNLGSGFLKQFKAIFDLPHNRLILERPSGR